MNKKGFTLTELLVVIAIIGVLSVIIIPSVVKINESINEREYEQRVTYIQKAAEMYASDKPDLFQGRDVAYVYVWQLINENYLNVDLDGNNDACFYYESGGLVTFIDESAPTEVRNSVLTAGCVSDPRNSSSLNSKRVKITKKTVGVVAEIEPDEIPDDTNGESELLVKKVCDAIKTNQVLGKYGANEGQNCECKYNATGTDVVDLVIKNSSTSVDSCILVSTSDSNGNVNNWLKYGSSSANWRVVGLYKVDGEIVAKIITSSVVD